MAFDGPALADTLALLAGSLDDPNLDDPNLDLAQGLARLTASVQAAVPSYRGLSITVLADGIPVMITAPGTDPAAPDPADPDPVAPDPVPGVARAADDDGALVAGQPFGDVAASLVVPLSAISPTAGGELVLFAGTPGAFVDLAADLAFETATELVTFALDTRFGAPVALTVGVEGFSLIHQAVGILVNAGRTPEQARARIAELAANDGHDLTAAANLVVTGSEG